MVEEGGGVLHLDGGRGSGCRVLVHGWFPFRQRHSNNIIIK